MNLTRREFLRSAGAVAGTAAIIAEPAAPLLAEAVPPPANSPAINPVFLTGSLEKWPLTELAEMGYRGLEVTQASLETIGDWRPKADKAGLKTVAVNAVPDLVPYLRGSLTDAVAYRREATLTRLLATLTRMRAAGIPHLIVTPSRLAENYQSEVEARALLVASLKTLAKAGDTNILLLASPNRLFSSSEKIASILDEVALPNVGAALNIGHTLLIGEDLPGVVQKLGKRLRYIQVNDADMRPGVARLNRYLPMGSGTAKKEEFHALAGNLPCTFTVAAPADPVTVARASLQWLK